VVTKYNRFYLTTGSPVFDVEPFGHELGLAELIVEDKAK
jgi:hypothetical protein